MLAKADLTTEVVGEFPELQGAMGRKYALLQGEHPSVAAAIEEHYKPQGPSDRVPTDPVSIAVALADKLDTLVGFWAIDEKPTGSQGPLCAAQGGAGGGEDCGREWDQVCDLSTRSLAPIDAWRDHFRRTDAQLTKLRRKLSTSSPSSTIA